MKTIACVSIFVLFLISLAIPFSGMSASAQTSGPSASGSYKFVLEDDFAKFIEFKAASDERGTTAGEMTFRDEAGSPLEDGEAGGYPDKPSAEFYLTANLDSLKIDRNQAVMGGTVTDSSDRRYIGKWVQLVVEDNGDGKETPDKLSWCFCQPEEGGWVPADAELKEDDGAWWKWWATDAERKDDVGVQSTNIIPGNKKGCQIFSLSDYPFADIRAGEGQIQVLP
jgi:hypothetical protein